MKINISNKAKRQLRFSDLKPGDVFSVDHAIDKGLRIKLATTDSYDHNCVFLSSGEVVWVADGLVVRRYDATLTAVEE